MSQLPLINTATMTSTKAMRAHKRSARRATAAESASQATPALSISAPVKPAAAPASGPTRSPESSLEFNLPDEDRVLLTLAAMKRCPQCGEKPSLERRRGKYRVTCGRRKYFPARHDRCPEPTPWLNSSAEAVRIWTLTQKLTQ